MEEEFGRRTFNFDGLTHFDLDVLKILLNRGGGRRRRDHHLRGQLRPELERRDELSVARRVEGREHLLHGGGVDVGVGRAQFRVKGLAFNAGHFDDLLVGRL